MALIKFGGGITAMSGSMAGNTFARNRYGNYMRARTKPTNKNTDRQVGARATMSSISERWSNVLTAIERDAWNEYANNVPVTNKLGESIKLSGFNHYVRSNTAILNAGLSVVDTAPSVFTLPEIDATIAATYVAADQEIAVAFDDTAAWAKEAGAALLVYQGAPQSPGVNFFNGPWRFADAILGVAPGGVATPQDVDSAFVITAAQKGNCQFRILRADGRLSEFFRAESKIVA